jgi:hypothetical protein
MSWMQKKIIAVFAVGVGVAIVLGATVGVGLARQTTPGPIGGVCQNGSPGCNIHLVGNAFPQPVAPATFMRCIPVGDWIGFYVWDAPNQRWLHYFNTATGNPRNLPEYLNDPAVGGASTIPGHGGIALIMRPGAPNEQRTFLHRAEQTCN